MIQIADKTTCCGCGACASICKKNSIVMVADKEGFLYPEISESTCIDCGLCEKVCPVLNKIEHEEITEGYIIRNRDEAVVKESTSGGAFTVFAEHFINAGGIVYGAGYGDNMKVIHKSAVTKDQLSEMRGSKFVQSDLGNTYYEIDSYLKNGKRVLFSGTPCQVEGLLCYLKNKPDNLLCVDFVCRGVPSPLLWSNYITMMEKKYDSKVIAAKFKNKTYGYHATTMKVDFANGKSWYGSGRIDPMMKAFVRELASRPSCSDCHFKGEKRNSDITMFDCYQFSNITGKKDDNKGYTSLFIHSPKGKELFRDISEKIISYPVSVDKLVTENGIMVNNSAKPNKKRNEFYKLANNYPIDEAMKRVSPITRRDQWIERCKDVLYKIGVINYVKRFKKKEIIGIVDD